jgi:hypothetical protein
LSQQLICNPKVIIIEGRETLMGFILIGWNEFI